MPPMASLDLINSSNNAANTSSSRLTEKSKANSNNINNNNNKNYQENGIKISKNTKNMSGNAKSASPSIRLLIFVEDTNAHRSNIFDSSKFIKKTPYNNTNSSSGVNLTSNLNLSNNILITNSNKNHTNTTTSTTNNNKSLNNWSSNPNTKKKGLCLTDMVFGSSPMVVSNRTAIKVHNLK